MLEQGKINSLQLFSLIISFIFGSTTILQSINVAGRDTWISAILANAAGIVGALMITYLADKFPGLNLAEYSEEIFGRVIGTIINISYIGYFLFLSTLVLRNFGDLMVTLVMPETSMWFFTLTFGMVAAYMVKSRLEALGRSAELILPVTLIFTILTTVLIYFSKKPDIGNLLPIMEKGIKPVLLGVIPISAFPFLEIVAFSMVIPYMNMLQKKRMVMILGVLFGGFLVTTILAQNISLFGEYIATLSFPRFFAVRLISVGRFIERIESFVLAIWLLSGLIKIGITLYASVLITAHTFRLSDYRFLVLPFTIISVVLSVVIFGNSFEMLNFAVNVYPIFALPFQMIFPVLMVILTAIKFRKNKKVQPTATTNSNLK